MFLRIFIAGFSSKNAHEIMGNNLYVFSTSYKTVNGFAMISEYRKNLINSVFIDYY